MSNTLTTLGKILTPEDQAERDAVHVACMPVVAGETLRPGGHVTLGDDNSTAILWLSDVPRYPLGIVDPFLKRPVMKGQTFWLWLYPNTITSLKHVWTHPEIPDA
jgi:hypothetical protein